MPTTAQTSIHDILPNVPAANEPTKGSTDYLAITSDLTMHQNHLLLMQQNQMQNCLKRNLMEAEKKL